MTTDDLLEARSVYGPWKETSATAQDIKAAFRSGRSWHKLLPSEREALEMIATKIARIVSGEQVRDNYVDIRGYAKLAEDHLP